MDDPQLTVYIIMVSCIFIPLGLFGIYKGLTDYKWVKEHFCSTLTHWRIPRLTSYYTWPVSQQGFVLHSFMTVCLAIMAIAERFEGLMPILGFQSLGSYFLCLIILAFVIGIRDFIHHRREKAGPTKLGDRI